MSFIIYKYSAGGKEIHYERLQTIRLSGPNGAIARFVRSLPGDTTDQSWELSPLDLTRLADVASAGDRLEVLFEASAETDDAVCLYRVRRICGVVRGGKTHLSLDLEVLVDQQVGASAEEFRRAFARPANFSGRRFREMLQLGGGLEGGLWKWETPILNLGATLVGPSS
jgi:hypothetical protein